MKPTKPIMGDSPTAFNARITLERPDMTRTATGGQAVTWTVVDTVYAIVDSYQSDEMTIAMQNTGKTMRRIKIRYRTDIKSNWRIGYQNKKHNIVGDPIDINENRTMLFFRVQG